MGIDLAFLGPLPLLQVIVGGLIAGVVTFAMIKGFRDAKKPGSGNGVQFYADGPLKSALDLLNRLVVATERMPGSAADMATLRDKAAELIRDSRHTLRGEMQREIAENDKQVEKIRAEFRHELDELWKLARENEKQIAVMEATRPRRG